MHHNLRELGSNRSGQSQVSVGVYLYWGQKGPRNKQRDKQSIHHLSGLKKWKSLTNLHDFQNKQNKNRFDEKEQNQPSRLTSLEVPVIQNYIVKFLH